MTAKADKDGVPYRRPINMADFQTNHGPLLDRQDSFENQVLFLQNKGWDATSITNQLHRSTTLTYANSRFENYRKSSSWHKLHERVVKQMGEPHE
jgi:hypothetical protein